MILTRGRDTAIDDRLYRDVMNQVRPDLAHHCEELREIAQVSAPSALLNRTPKWPIPPLIHVNTPNLSQLCPGDVIL